MRFDFKLIPQKDLEGLVKSVFDKTGKKYEDEAVAAIARAGAGSARDSLSIADMCASYASGKLTYEDVNAVLGSADFFSVAALAENILCEDPSSALSGIEQILSTGKSVGVLVKDLLTFLNNCAIIKMCKNAREIVNLPTETFSRIEEIALKCDGHKILRVTEILSGAETDMRYSLNGRITLETAVLKSAMPQTDYNIDALIGRIDQLERKLSEGVKIAVSQQKPEVVRQIEKPAEKPAAKKAVLQVEEDLPPFAAPKAEQSEKHVQPSLWEAAPVKAGSPRTLTEDDKKSVFGKFIRSLRTTHRNAVLFTLCMDLGNSFEGEKLIMTTESEAVLKGLTKADNAKFIAEALAELGVGAYEVRLVKKGISPFDKAVSELKSNFDGIDIEIK